MTNIADRWGMFPIQDFEPGLDEARIAQVRTWYEEDNHPDRERHIAGHIAGLSLVRNALLSATEYVTEHDVVDILGFAETPTPSIHVGVFRENGRLLSIEDHGRNIYPLFQFEPKSALVSPYILKVAGVLKPQRDNLEVLSWWLTPRVRADSKPFAAVIHTQKGQKIIDQELQGYAR